MKSKTTLSLLALSVILPSSTILQNQSAYASRNNIQVRAGNVRVTTQNNGSINVNTGTTSVNVPTQRHSTWYPWRYWRTPWQSTCHQSSYQQSTQMSNLGKKVVHHSSTSSYCR